MTRLRKGGDELAWTDIGPLDGDDEHPQLWNTVPLAATLVP